MADNPYGGAAEGFQSGFNNTVQMMGMKRLLLQQKVQNLIAGFKEMNDRLADPNWSLSTKNTIVNSPAYRNSFKMLTGADLPPSIQWDADFNSTAKRINGILGSKASWGDKRQEFLKVVNETPGMADKFKDTSEFLKQATAPLLGNVDVGGKTVSIGQNQATGENSVLNVPGMGPAVSTSQKSIEQQSNAMSQYQAKKQTLLDSLAKVEGYKSSWLGKMVEPASLEQARNAELNTAKMTMTELGFNKDEIQKALDGKDIHSALERIGKQFQVPGTPATPDTSTAGLPGMTIVPKAATPAPAAPAMPPVATPPPPPMPAAPAPTQAKLPLPMGEMTGMGNG